MRLFAKYKDIRNSYTTITLLENHSQNGFVLVRIGKFKSKIDLKDFETNFRLVKDG